MKENVDAINISLPTSTWNITDIELNFTNVKLGKEIKTIEDGGSDYRIISSKPKHKSGYGVQINITEPTTLFGVYINGFMELVDDAQPADDIFVQLRGNNPDNTPNETIYASRRINIDETFRWYPQIFSTPIYLNKTFYYLVINGTGLTGSDETLYYWFNNEDVGTHTDPTLHIAKYDGSWSDDGTDKNFRYRLIQRVNRSYDPEDINMTVEFDGTNYAVKNGLSPYTGDLNISNQNFSPDDENLYITIRNNESIELLVNFSYIFNQKNIFSSAASVLIENVLPNKWTIAPNIARTDGNYSIEFERPESWYNLTIFRDKGAGWENITKNVTLINNFIFIPNKTITEGALWKITANSPNVDFSLSIPTTVYGPSQTIRITVDPPTSPGNLTFILVDPYGDEDFRDEIGNPSAQEILLYSLPINPFSGTWQALIYWNNNTDAGLLSISLQINISIGDDDDDDGDSTIITGLDPQLVFMVVLAIILVSLAGLTTYQLTKRHKKAKAEHRQKIFNKYMDVLNLNYIIIIDKNSGLNVYEQILAGKDMDVSLITGFLEAIRTFGIELTGAGEESQAISLDYQNMNIIMSDFKNFRIISIMKESPSPDFLESLKPLSHDIDTYYGKSLKNFDGNVSQFKGIKDLLDDHLQISLIYPLKIVKSKDVKLDISERALVNKALDIMKKRKINHFYVSYLMSGKEFNVGNAERILKLINKKVFQPLN